MSIGLRSSLKSGDMRRFGADLDKRRAVFWSSPEVRVFVNVQFKLDFGFDAKVGPLLKVDESS
jgi:hypothetical protein